MQTPAKLPPKDPAAAEASSLEAEISRILNLEPDGIRALWQDTFKRPPPKVLTRDLLARMLCWHVQERALGGHDRATIQILAGYTKGRPDAQRSRYLRPGTEIVREYQGERHTVTVTTGGFQWRGGDYPSLTAIARAITGTNWNGPRFFGLRTATESQEGAGRRNDAAGKTGPEKPPKSPREAAP